MVEEFTYIVQNMVAVPKSNMGRRPIRSGAENKNVTMMMITDCNRVDSRYWFMTPSEIRKIIR